MTFRDAYLEGRRLLSDAWEAAPAPESHRTPGLDALVLLAFASGRSKEQVLASYPDPLSIHAEEAYREALRRRLDGEPVSYIRGTKEFYGLDLLVDRRVLVPRPETEILVDATLREIRRRGPVSPGTPLRYLDLCTGSGAVAVAVATETPSEEVDIAAGDLSPAALEVAAQNARRHCPGRVRLVQSDLFAGFEGSFDVITANPPYLTEEEYRVMDESGWPEPRQALVAGPDGLAVIRRLIAGAVDHLTKNGYFITECAVEQATEVATSMRSLGFGEVEYHLDLAGRRRAVAGRWVGAEGSTTEGRTATGLNGAQHRRTRQEDYPIR